MLEVWVGKNTLYKKNSLTMELILQFEIECLRNLLSFFCAAFCIFCAATELFLHDEEDL